MRRRSNSEPDFGSDSFLDIIANIVGILIILIVVAGVKVSRQPVARLDVNREPIAGSVKTAVSLNEDANDETKLPQLTGSSTALPVMEPEHSTIVEDPWDSADRLWIAVEEPSAEPRVEPSAPVLAVHPSPELLQRRNELSRSVLKVKSRLTDARRQQSSLDDLVTSRSEQVKTATIEVSETAEKLKIAQQAAQGSRRRLEINRRKLATLKTQLKTAQEPRTKVETIRHRLNPVSQEVSEKEVHFRLSNKRLSIVPIAELLEETMRQIRRRSESLMRFNRHTGRVGPIGGYAMNYVVQRQSLNVLEKLREGGGYVRIEVSESTLEPTDSLREMTVEEALRSGSEFSSRLHQVGPDTSLTFWVYPDSFEAFRTIQSVLHDLGFAVAARPIPEGTPIGVSPRGSRSNAQ